ncbi:unnamed protein product [Phytophthora fragariaefolia]|uniref:Unnamed protein product n=1 Tax=Phytophthora fragariaefolia TaxID=1490495 RepID=A0A9W7CZ98_9STRA|nr:unnamed protein product [Phytophthora fragariaefolia]
MPRRSTGIFEQGNSMVVLDKSVLELWHELFLSPREHFPTITYNPPRDIARRIYELRTKHSDAEVLIILGDVSRAFRHVSAHEDAVHMFAFAVDAYVVIDLSCGFGWCGSPAYYSLVGSTSNDIYESSYPAPNTPLDQSPFHGTCGVTTTPAQN